MTVTLMFVGDVSGRSYLMAEPKNCPQCGALIIFSEVKLVYVDYVGPWRGQKHKHRKRV